VSKVNHIDIMPGADLLFFVTFSRNINTRQCPLNILGAWIITGGLATGVMQLVGEAVKEGMSADKHVVAIGIAAWGCIANRQALEGEGVGT